ncbi:MAG: UDP-3-O-(3-hydroxymyristoyl)glucosamine N-acyltransferase [Planctomycetes bacterium]|nr:UDP-3-O-(3-hydroxymyristoyl)glucosamine N-acyltransferase [Planctomycetota bacterium]
MGVNAAAVFEEFRKSGVLLGMRGRDVPISGVAAADSCGEGDLVFVETDAYVAPVLARRPAVVVTRPEWVDRFSETTVLTSNNVRLAHALIRQRYFDRDLRNLGWTRIHPSAVVHESARIAEGAFIGPNTMIGRGAHIGERVVVMANVVVEEDAVVGDDAVLYPCVVVGFGCEIGRATLIRSGSIIGSEGFGFAQDEQRRNYRIPQLGKVVIEDRVVIGANCCIDRATFGETRIGSGTVMDNLCHVAHNVRIGRDCILTAMLCVAGSTHIGDRVITSGQTGILDHVKIADDTILLHRAGVMSDITESGQYAGGPTQRLRDYLKNQAVARRLSDLRAAVRELERNLGKGTG